MNLIKFTYVNLKKEIFNMSKEFKVEGLKCSGCAKAVENAVGAVEGVSEAKINLEAQRLTVQFLQNEVEDQKIIEAVSKEGYQAALV